MSEESKGVNLARNVAGRGLVLLVDDARAMQTLQIGVLDNETIEGAERIQEYGFSSHPLPEAEIVALFIGADRSHPIVVACDDRRYRLSLQPGEVALYTDEGDNVVLRRGRVIEVSTSHLVVNAADDVAVTTGTVDIKAPGGTTIHGDVLVEGSLTWTGTAQGRDGAARFSGGLSNRGGQVDSNGVVLESHVHGGVQPGNGSTGQPE